MAPNSPRERLENATPHRRQFLRAAGIAGLTTLAGCSGGDGDGETDADGNDGSDGSDGSDGNSGGDGSDSEDTETEAGDPIDSAFTTSVGTNPTDLQYNTYNSTGESSAEVEAVIYEPLVKKDKVNDEWIPVTVSDWQFDGAALDLELNPDYVWHDGDPVTAEDLAVQFRLDIELGLPTADHVSSVEVTGDHSLRLNLTSDTVNTEILFLNVLDTRLTTKAERFKPYLESIKEATSTEEKESAQTELLEWSITDPVGSGPFKFDGADTQRVLTVKHDEYPGSDQINFPEYEFRYMGGNQERWQAMMSDVTDGEPHLGITQEVLDQMPDHVDLIRPPEEGGVSLAFQHKDTVFSDPRVRKAITYALKGDVLTGDSTLNYQFQELAMNTGMMPTQAESYLSEDLRNSMTNYNVEQSEAEDRATELLEQAGFSLENGTWMKPNGEPFQLPIKTIGSWWSIQAQSITAQLQEFGIQAEFVSQGLGTFFSDFGDGNYVMAISFYSGSHPSQTFSTVFGSADGGMNAPAEYEVPMPVGNPYGSTETVNVRDLIDQLGNTRDEAEIKEIVEKLAWTYNQTVPRVPHLIGTGMTFMTNDEWSYPALDDPVMSISDPPFWLLRSGDLRAKTE